MKNLLFLFLFILGMSLSSCGGCGAETDNNSTGKTETPSSNSATNEGGGDAADGEPANLADAIKQAEKAIKDSGAGNQVEVINFRELQKHLPEKLAGMERTSKGGQTAGAMGMTVSTAEAKYKTDNGTQVEITLADTGGMGFVQMGAAAWATAVIDREDENGSERTSTIDGFKSFEKVEARNQKCELNVLAKGRYIVTAQCRKCEMGQLKDAVRGMGLDDLPEGKSK